MDTGPNRAPGGTLELDSLLTPAVASIGGAIGLLSGTITALTSAQTLTVVYIDGPAAFAPYLLLAIGVATAAAGVKLLGGHGWAAIASAALNGLLFLTTSVWLVYSAVNGYFSALALVNPGLGMIAGTLSLAAIKPCIRVSAARKESAGPGLFKGV